MYYVWTFEKSKNNAPPLGYVFSIIIFSHYAGLYNNNRAKFAPTKCSIKLSGKTDRFLKVMPSSDKCTAVCQAGSRETRPPQESDDSDSEIFRVKRRSTLSLQKRRAEVMISNIFQQKVYFLYAVFIATYYVAMLL